MDFFTAFMHRTQVYNKGPQLQTDIQLGEDVWVWIGTASAPGEKPKMVSLPGVLVGVHLMSEAASFDVAFQIGSSEVYSVVRNVLSHITRPGEQYNPLGLPDGANEGQGGFEADAESKLEGFGIDKKVPPRPRPRLVAVHNKDSQLAADEAVVDRAEAAPPALSVVATREGEQER